jgi:hypothetical protein
MAHPGSAAMAPDEPADADDTVEIPQWTSLDEICEFNNKAGFGRFTPDALQQSKRQRLTDPCQSTVECNVNVKFEDDNDMQTPQSPPKAPRPPTTPPLKITHQLDDMSHQLKSLWVVADTLRTRHKTSLLTCFNRLNNLENNVKYNDRHLKEQLSDVITRIFAKEKQLDTLLAQKAQLSEETASIIEPQTLQSSNLTKDVIALRNELDELKTVVRFLTTNH